MMMPILGGGELMVRTHFSTSCVRTRILSLILMHHSLSRDCIRIWIYVYIYE